MPRSSYAENRAASLDLFRGGATAEEIAEAAGVKPITAYRWALRFHRSGLLAELPAEPAPAIGRRGEAALALLRKGATLEEAGAAVDAHPSQVSRWRAGMAKAGHAPAIVPLVEQSEAEDANPFEVIPGETRLATLERRRTVLDRMAAAAARDGMHAVASRHSRDSIALEALISRELERAGGVGGHSFTDAEIREGARGFVHAIKALTDRPLLCEACSRELSIAWGELTQEQVALLEKGEDDET
jgi:hypothetical protein